MENIQVISIPQERIVEGSVFPLTLSPNETNISLSHFFGSNKSFIDDLLRKHRAILFRGFSDTVTYLDFDKIVKSADYLTMPYIGGAAVRTPLTDRVFTANESPATEKIPFHHEMAQTPNPPTHLIFYCEKPAMIGGETPILVSNEIYQYIYEKYPLFTQKIESLGVKYIRYLPTEDDPTSAIGRGWKSTYNCLSKEEAEEQLRALGSEWEWMPNGDLKTITAIVPAIRVDHGDNRSEQKTFYNSIVAAFTGWNDSRNKGKRAVVTGDGEYLDPIIINDIDSLMQKISVSFLWEQGDVLLVDNRTSMHARKTFQGPRRILASLARDPTR